MLFQRRGRRKKSNCYYGLVEWFHLLFSFRSTVIKDENLWDYILSNVFLIGPLCIYVILQTIRLTKLIAKDDSSSLKTANDEIIVKAIKQFKFSTIQAHKTRHYSSFYPYKQNLKLGRITGLSSSRTRRLRFASYSEYMCCVNATYTKDLL